MNRIDQPMGVCVIVVSDAGVLMGKRLNAYKSGLHGLPGGRVEMGEALNLAAQRELVEETGLVAYEMKYLGVVRESQETRDFIHFVFECSDYEGEVVVAEPVKCEGWEWYALDDLPSDVLPGHAQAVDLYKNAHGQFNLRDMHGGI